MLPYETSSHTIPWHSCRLHHFTIHFNCLFKLAFYILILSSQHGKCCDKNYFAGDNKNLAAIVRNILAEFGANHAGTVYYDPTTDNLSELFQKEKSIYYVALVNEVIVGGAGIFPSAGLPEKTCELVKMYLSKNARGQGLGKLLIEKCIALCNRTGVQTYLS